MTDKELRLAAGLLNVVTDLQAIIHALISENDPEHIPTFIRAGGNGDEPVAAPPKCVHGILFSDPCADCANNQAPV